MANPFDQFDAPPAAAAANPFDQFDAPPPKQFDVLPLNKDASGGIHFDPSAGVLGSMIQAFKAPGDVWQGNLDPRSPEANQRALTLATMANPINPAMRAGDFAIPGVMKNLKPATPKAPTADALKNAASSGYDAANATGAAYPGEAVGAVAKDTVNSLNNDGILAELAPQTHAVLNKLSNPPDGSTVTISSLDAARKALGRIGGNFTNPTEQEAARRGVASIDKFIQDAGAPAPMAGSAAPTGAGAIDGAGAAGSLAVPTAESEAARLIREARGNAAAAFRSDRITGAEDAAELRAAAANSGQNIGNSLRQRLASLLLNPKQIRGFASDEIDAIRQVVEGTATSNTLRKVGNMFGGGGGIGHTLVGALGAVAGGSVGGVEGAAAGAAALPLMGSAARSSYNSLVGRQLTAADNLIRTRSPLYQQMQRATPNVAQGSPGQAALVRGTLLGQDSAQPNPGGMPFNPAISQAALQQILASRLGQRFPLAPGGMSSLLNPSSNGPLG